MTESKLGKLERVELREQWNREDTDFTPWLSNEQNLKYLGDSIGMDLELVETEMHVGPYRADILCRDASEAYVLIENQLEPTDHIHLGQLMTYAAGLDTVHIIWVAKKFNDEHRAALDWLNRITVEGFHFFGVEVELWKIGDSLPAPKFNIVSKPNEWQKSVRAEKQAIQSARATILKEVWTNLIDYLEPRLKDIDCPKPSSGNWIRFILNDDTHITVGSALSIKKLNLYVVFKGEESVSWFQYAKGKRNELDRTMSESFEWITENDGGGYAQLIENFDHETPASYEPVFEMFSSAITSLQSFIADSHEEFIKEHE